MGLLCLIDQGVTLIDFLCKYTSKGHFYPKNKFQEVMKKIRMFYIQECRDIVSLNTEILEKPWKSIKVTPISRYINNVFIKEVPIMTIG